MPNPILKIKRGSGAPVSLAVGELAIDQLNKSLFVGTSDGPLAVGGEHIFAKKTYADSAVASEASLRSTADATLTTNLASEVTRAQAAEGTLTTNLAGEITRATAAEAALGTRIDNVLSNVTPGSLDSLSEIVTAFQAADSNLNGAITSLAASASTGLQNEVTRATGAESALGTRIDGVVSAATALTSRVSAAESDIVSNASAISAEVTARTSAVSAEASTRASADTSLGNRLTSLETEIDGGTY